jgi:chaperonin GroEL (HSP60 family)
MSDAEIDTLTEMVDSLVEELAELIRTEEIDGTGAIVVLAHALTKLLVVANNETADLLVIWDGLSAQVADSIRYRHDSMN